MWVQNGGQLLDPTRDPTTHARYFSIATHKTHSIKGKLRLSIVLLSMPFMQVLSLV